jgi:alkylhydroperoxidase family enzyme
MNPEVPMAWIRVIPPDEATGELADQYRKIGGTPDNILSIHSLNPASLRAHLDLYTVCMRGRSELSRAQREMVAVVVSAANRCHY